jgi:hypothetical protein
MVVVVAFSFVRCVDTGVFVWHHPTHYNDQLLPRSTQYECNIFLVVCICV